jgi:hypothetical protein
MPTIASKRRSSFGTDCVQCGNELIAPERSEHRDERHILHLWRCPKCDCSFEVISPADTKSINDVMTRIEDIMTGDDLLASRVVRQGQFMGSSAQPLQPGARYGVLTDPNPPAPAANAGIEAGDVVTRINGSPVMNWRDFTTTISAMEPRHDGLSHHVAHQTIDRGPVIIGSSKCRARPRADGVRTR